MGTQQSKEEVIPLTDARLRNLKTKEKAYQEPDEGGLFVEVMPGGTKAWRLRYRLAGKQEKVTPGEYPSYSLADARAWRECCKTLIGRGLSPMPLKHRAPRLRAAARLHSRPHALAMP